MEWLELDQPISYDDIFAINFPAVSDYLPRSLLLY